MEVFEHIESGFPLLDAPLNGSFRRDRVALGSVARLTVLGHAPRHRPDKHFLVLGVGLGNLSDRLLRTLFLRSDEVDQGILSFDENAQFFFHRESTFECYDSMGSPLAVG